MRAPNCGNGRSDWATLFQASGGAWARDSATLVLLERGALALEAFDYAVDCMARRFAAARNFEDSMLSALKAFTT